MQRKRKVSETRALKQIRKPAVRIHRDADLAGRARLPARCTRELDVEPTGAPDEDVCLGEIDARTGCCRTCGKEAQP
jgi:hypothetical protein